MKYTKRKAILFENVFEKQENEELKLVEERHIDITGKEFDESVAEMEKSGTKVSIKYVAERPQRMRFNEIYILKTPAGRPDYIYVNVIA